MSKLILSLFFVLFTLIPSQINADDLTNDEVISLTRDHLGRKNPDELTYGFIPVWAVVIYVIAATFLVISIISGVCYIFGCRNDKQEIIRRSFD